MRTLLKTGLLLNLLAVAVGTDARLLAGEIQATEVMMESEGLQAILLGQVLGGDDATTLSFTSQVDSQGSSFQYSVASGSTYQGLSLSWTTSGAFDTTSGLWSWTTTSSIGTFNLGSTGGGGPFTGGDPPYFGQLNLDLPLPPLPPPPKTVVSNVTYTQTASRTVSEGTITVYAADNTVISSGTHFDQYILQGPDAGSWMWDTGLITAALGKGDFQVAAAGFTPAPAGGAGNFTLQINAVPEPSTIILASIAGLVGLGVALCRRTGLSSIGVSGRL
jgi:hypothetical protein